MCNRTGNNGSNVIGFIALVLLTGLCPPAAQAQEAEVEAEGVELEPSPEVEAELQAQPSESPDEDVMRRTSHVVRFTPKMAKGLAREFVKEQTDRPLDSAESQELEEVMARRMMNVGHRHAEDIAPFFEQMYVEMIKNQGESVTREGAPRLGALAEKAAPAFRTFADGMAEDMRPFVSDEKYNELLELETNLTRASSELEEEMARWARGEIPEEDDLDHPFEIFEQKMKQAEEDQVDIQRSKLRKDLDQQSQWNYWQKTPQAWRWFLRSLSRRCEFSDEQDAQGNEILRTYEKQAKEIMTPEWEKRIQRNRLLHRTQYHLVEEREAAPDEEQPPPAPPTIAQNIQPWLFQLNVEYDQMTAPLDELRDRFRQEVLAIVTQEQRDKLNEELRALGTRHGMEPAMIDEAITMLVPEEAPTPEIPENDAGPDERPSESEEPQTEPSS